MVYCNDFLEYVEVEVRFIEDFLLIWWSIRWCIFGIYSHTQLSFFNWRFNVTEQILSALVLYDRAVEFLDLIDFQGVVSTISVNNQQL